CMSVHTHTHTPHTRIHHTHSHTTHTHIHHTHTYTTHTRTHHTQAYTTHTHSYTTHTCIHHAHTAPVASVTDSAPLTTHTLTPREECSLLVSDMDFRCCG